MGLISQIINKFLPTKPHSSAADGWENPYGSGAGQIVVSEQENWMARISRLGQGKSAYASNVAMTQGTGTAILAVRPSGANGYITHVCISTTGPGMAYINFQRAVNGTSEFYAKYLPASGSFEIDVKGAIMIADGANLNCMFKADGSGTNAYASVLWLEVNS